MQCRVELRAGIEIEQAVLKVRGIWVPLDGLVVQGEDYLGDHGVVTVHDVCINLDTVSANIAKAVNNFEQSDLEPTMYSPALGESVAGDLSDTATSWSDAVLSGQYVDRATLYLKVNSSSDALMGGAVFETGAPENMSEQARVSYLVTFGRFQRTNIETLSERQVRDSTVTPYVNRRGVMGIRLNARVGDFQSVIVSKLRMEGSVLNLRGELRVRHTRIRTSDLVLTARGLPLRWSAPLRITRDYEWEQSHFGHGRYEFDIRMDFQALVSGELPTDVILDAWIESTTESTGGSKKTTRIGRTPLIQRQLSNIGGVRGAELSTLIIPYYTMKAKRTSFRLERFFTPAYDEVRKVMGLGKRLEVMTQRRRPVWLIGEQPAKAQDTGLAFFRYMRANHPEIDAYYVIDLNAVEARNLSGLDNVVNYRSTEHIQLALAAERFIGSHHASYLYPTRAEKFEALLHSQKIFLQHGVIAMKWMAETYGKNVSTFDTDLFIVSSVREKGFIVNDLGYRPKEVAVTGLSRFDTLFNGDTETNDRQIFIMPTWRDWLHTGEQFLASRYFQAWHDFLADPDFIGAVQNNGLDVIFCLHPNMQPYAEFFTDLPVRLLVQGETDIQHLIKESALLVTDYSSVAWDFSFLNKPVLFFQFDRNRMFKKAQPHLDLDRELPGPIVSEVQPLVTAFVDRMNDGFEMDRKYRDRADNFIQHRDTKNSARIFEEIRNMAAAKRAPYSGSLKEIQSSAFNYFRKSKYYHPTMRKFYRMLSQLPSDPAVAFFESGLGRQTNDSPRAIYDELVRRGDARKKVWSVRGRASFSDPNTIVVKRYSPSYFWYLGRARYIVSNQNLPFYIKRGRGRTYMQTWHGTPLKRMAADIEEIHGRDSGYLSRVTSAASQWSVLVSPSPYATECLRSAYGYKGEAVEIGYPRNDLLVSPERAFEARRIREQLGISQDARTVLYAPTFRDDQATGNGRFAFDLPFSLDDFHELFGEGVVLLIRTHSLVAGRLQIPADLRHVVLDVSRYPDIQPLYLAADCLVTDYSSVFFDYSLLRRPMIFFAYDLEIYRDALRGFYLDYESTVPGPVVTTESEFFDALESALYEPRSSVEEIDSFVERFNPRSDGRATQRVTDLLLTLGAGNQQVDSRARGIMSRCPARLIRGII